MIQSKFEIWQWQLYVHECLGPAHGTDDMTSNEFDSEHAMYKFIKPQVVRLAAILSGTRPAWPAR